MRGSLRLLITTVFNSGDVHTSVTMTIGFSLPICPAAMVFVVRVPVTSTPSIVPGGTASDVHNFDGEFRRVFAGMRFFERQQHAAIGRLAGTHRFAGQSGAPQRRALRQSDFQKIALALE